MILPLETIDSSLYLLLDRCSVASLGRATNFPYFAFVCLVQEKEAMRIDLE